MSALETFDLESFILAPNPPTETIVATDATAAPIPNPAYVAWKKKDRFILLWIKSTLSESALGLVARSTSSLLAWTAIERNYQAQSMGRWTMKNQLQNITKGASSMRDYIQRKRSIADSLEENLQPVSEEDLIGHILNGLDSSYNPFITSFMMTGTDLKVDTLIGLLFREEDRIARDLARQATMQLQAPILPEHPTPSPSANTMSRSGGRHFNSSSSGSSNGPRQQESRHHDSRRRRPQCQLCNKPGHEAIDCWQRGNQVDFPSRRPNPRDTQKQAHMAEFNSPSTIDPSWYFDTGATDHVSPDVRKVATSEDYSGTDKLQVGNGNQLSISHIGSCSLHNLKLPNVVIAPRLTKHLISVFKLCRDNNVMMEFWPHLCRIKTFQGRTILQGDVNHGLYRLPTNATTTAPSMALTSIRTSLHWWHCRLGHPHEAILRRLVSNFKLPISSNKLPDVCDSFQLGKSHRFHLPTSHIASSRPFELIYSDV